MIPETLHDAEIRALWRSSCRIYLVLIWWCCMMGKYHCGSPSWPDLHLHTCCLKHSWTLHHLLPADVLQPFGGQTTFCFSQIFQIVTSPSREAAEIFLPLSSSFPSNCSFGHFQSFCRWSWNGWLTDLLATVVVFGLVSYNLLFTNIRMRICSNGSNLGAFGSWKH